MNRPGHWYPLRLPWCHLGPPLSLWLEKSLVREEEGGGKAPGRLVVAGAEAPSEDRPYSRLFQTHLVRLLRSHSEPVFPQDANGPELRGHKIDHPSSLS